MISIALPETSWQDLDLQLESSQVINKKGAKRELPRQLKGWISLGEPASILLTQEHFQEDNELLDFFKAQKVGYKFYLTQFACTFRPPEDELFENAWLEIKLFRTDNIEERRPIAWSMAPKQLFKPIEVSQTAKLAGSLKLVQEIVGIEANIETQEKYKKDEIFLEALNERASNPTWELSKTDNVKIKGTYRFNLITRVSNDVKAHGEVGLIATVLKKRFGVIPYRATFPKTPQFQFKLE